MNCDGRFRRVPGAKGSPLEYYRKLADLMTDISGFGFPNDTEFACYLIERIAAPPFPGSSFCAHSEHRASANSLLFLQEI
jgi:hypothetical protein